MRIYVDDLTPEMVFTISDPDTDVDATSVPITLIGTIDGDVVVSRAPDSAVFIPGSGTPGADDEFGVTRCQLDWQPGETSRAGRMKFKAVVEWLGMPDPQTIKPLSTVRIRP